MKRINRLYEKLISDENMELAIKEVNRTHRWLPGHRPNKVAFWVEQTMRDRIVELRDMIETGFVPSPVRKRKRWDKSAGKWRDICEPRLYPDQYIHHALIQVLRPVLLRGMDKYCCASVEGRGIRYGMQALQKWMRKDVKGTKYCLELDIRHYYDTLKPPVVIDQLKTLVKDHKVLDLAERIMRDGVQIGVYCSQWFANVVLQPLDHLIREGGYGVSHYLRYMDNFTVFASGKRKLRKLLRAIRDWLHERGLEIKGNWQIYPTKSRLPSALGYRYGRGYTLLRKRNLLRIRRQIAEYHRRKRKRKKISFTLASGLLSRLGQLKYCNHTHLYADILPQKMQKELKDIVRTHIKKEMKKWNTFLDMTMNPATRP